MGDIIYSPRSLFAVNFVGSSSKDEATQEKFGHKEQNFRYYRMHIAFLTFSLSHKSKITEL